MPTLPIACLCGGQLQIWVNLKLTLEHSGVAVTYFFYMLPLGCTHLACTHLAASTLGCTYLECTYLECTYLGHTHLASHT